MAFTDSDCRADEDWLYYIVSDLVRSEFVGMGGPNLLPPEDSELAAAVMVPGQLRGVASAFFEGAGYGYAHIISLIVAANCFGQAIREIGIAHTMGEFIREWPDLLMPAAGIIPLAFAALCGSGMASTQSLFNFFAEPALLLDIDPTHVGAVVSVASAAGTAIRYSASALPPKIRSRSATETSPIARRHAGSTCS